MRAATSLRPPPRQKLSTWIEANIRLPPEVAAQPGPVRLFPFQRDIADAMGDPTLERVTVLKAARIGYSTLLTGVIGSYIANDPANILALLPREEDCRTLVVGQLDPTFAASPNLANVLAERRSRNKRNRLFHRLFPGGWFKAVAATSDANMRAHTARVLVIDEVDAMEESKEGSPVDLAIVRTKTFDNRKIILGSTPVNTSTSHVIASWEESDQRVYECPCPHCGDFHEIRWKDIRWPDEDTDKAAWWCPSCGTETPEIHKGPMVAKGRWRATRPDVKGHAGFRLSALVSPLRNSTWAKIADEFVKAQGRPDKLKTFINTTLGEGWKDEGDEIDEDAIASSAEPFGLEPDAERDIDGIPAEVLAITVGVDVQRKDRLEITFVGWAEDGTAFILGHRVIWGLPSDESTWRELDEMLRQTWAHPLGGRLGVDAVAVDSGDGETMQFVYDFCRPRFARKVYAIKGDGGKRPAWVRSKSNNGRLWIVGVDGIKSTIFTRVTRSRSIRFSKTLEPAWFEQFASERAVLRRHNGRPVRKWERIKGRAAEALDCVTYAFACREALNINWAARAEQLANPTIETRPAPKRRKESFLDRIMG